MGVSVVHFEMNGPDGPALARFYANMFGWHVQEIQDASYWIIDTHAGTGINGGMGQPPTGRGFGTFYGPGVSPGDNPPVDWFEILGSDAERTQGFYRDLFGWNRDETGDTSYSVVQHEHDAAGRDLQIGGGLAFGVYRRS